MKRLLPLIVILLVGCQTAEQIEHDRKVKISKMDNLDICYNLGRQHNFEYWKMIKKEQAMRSFITKTWNVSDATCNQAKAKGREDLERDQQSKDDLVNAINNSVKSINNGYKNSENTYHSTSYTNCQTYGSVTNCMTY